MKATRGHFRVLLAGLAAWSFLSIITKAMAQFYSFQQGVNGYTGQVDTQIRQAGVQSPAPATDDSGLNPINSDNQDGCLPCRVQALIRFNDIVGNGPGQIPLGTTICNATLILRSTANNANSSGPVRVHRMLEDWPTTTTWANSFDADGIQANDIEANVSQDGADIIPDFPDPNGDPSRVAERMVDVTASVQAWADGVLPNYGWVLINTNNNGYLLDSAETAIVTNRPSLRVYSGHCPPLCLVGPTNTTALECRTATFTVVVCSTPPVYFQWLREETPGNFHPIDPMANPTATNSTLIISNAQPELHGGRYKVQAVDRGGSTESQTAILTVVPDEDGPVAIFALANPERTQVTINYNEPVLPSDGMGNNNAQDPHDYVIAEVGNPSNRLNVQTNPLPAIENKTNIVLTIDPAGQQWIEGTLYQIEIAPDIPDACNYIRSSGQFIVISPPPRVTITHNRAENTIAISWSPAVGRLRESTDLVSWTDSARQNGVAFPNPGEVRFYRIER